MPDDYIPALGDVVNGPGGLATVVGKDGLGDAIVEYGADAKGGEPRRTAVKIADLSPRVGSTVKGEAS